MLTTLDVFADAAGICGHKPADQVVSMAWLLSGCETQC